jgi:peptidoglycan hydrolase-like protein with peptidoglycan-binding domain
VRDYQRARGLAVTGFVGTATRAELNNTR